MAHYDGDDNCGEHCNGPHIDPVPAGFICKDCGSSQSACYVNRSCAMRPRRFEEFEGSTGTEEWSYDEYGSAY